MITWLSLMKWAKYPRHTESGRTLTIRIYHNRSIVLERSVINYWGLINRFYIAITLALASATIHKHTRSAWMTSNSSIHTRSAWMTSNSSMHTRSAWMTSNTSMHTRSAWMTSNSSMHQSNKHINQETLRWNKINTNTETLERQKSNSWTPVGPIKDKALSSNQLDWKFLGRSLH